MSFAAITAVDRLTTNPYGAAQVDVVRGEVLDGAFALALDPWGTEYPTSFAGVLALRCEHSGACDAQRDGEQIRTLAAALAAEPGAIDGTELTLNEGLLASMTQEAIGGGDLPSFLAAVHAANDGDHAP